MISFVSFFIFLLLHCLSIVLCEYFYPFLVRRTNNKWQKMTMKIRHRRLIQESIQSGFYSVTMTKNNWSSEEQRILNENFNIQWLSYKSTRSSIEVRETQWKSSVFFFAIWIIKHLYRIIKRARLSSLSEENFSSSREEYEKIQKYSIHQVKRAINSAQFIKSCVLRCIIPNIEKNVNLILM